MSGGDTRNRSAAASSRRPVRAPPEARELVGGVVDRRDEGRHAADRPREAEHGSGDRRQGQRRAHARCGRAPPTRAAPALPEAVDGAVTGQPADRHGGWTVATKPRPSRPPPRSVRRAGRRCSTIRAASSDERAGGRPRAPRGGRRSARIAVRRGRSGWSCGRLRGRVVDPGRGVVGPRRRRGPNRAGDRRRRATTPDAAGRRSRWSPAGGGRRGAAGTAPMLQTPWKALSDRTGHSRAGPHGVQPGRRATDGVPAPRRARRGRRARASSAGAAARSAAASGSGRATPRRAEPKRRRGSAAPAGAGRRGARSECAPQAGERLPQPEVGLHLGEHAGYVGFLHRVDEEQRRPPSGRGRTRRGRSGVLVAAMQAGVAVWPVCTAHAFVDLGVSPRSHGHIECAP